MSDAPVKVRQSESFARWLKGLRDGRARARIELRLRRLSLGNFGDIRTVGGGIAELRVDYGPSYRIYFVRRGATLVLLLAGGDKSTQSADIARARSLAEQWETE